jgi:hypothetical protein
MQYQCFTILSILYNEWLEKGRPQVLQSWGRWDDLIYIHTVPRSFSRHLHFSLVVEPQKRKVPHPVKQFANAGSGALPPSFRATSRYSILSARAASRSKPIIRTEPVVLRSCRHKANGGSGIPVNAYSEGRPAVCLL